MKKLLLLTIILIPGLLLGVAKEGEEIQILDDLIASTERQLVIHKELRSSIDDFHKQQERFHKGEQTKDLAIQMVMTASKIYKTAEEHNLMYLFTPFFIEELKLFAGMSKKKNHENH